MEKFNESLYFLKEGSLFENKDLNQSFMDFLKKEYNQGPLLFLNKVKTYEKMFNKNQKVEEKKDEKKEETKEEKKEDVEEVKDEEKIKLMLQIIEEFILEKSSNELNLTHKDKDRIINFYKDQKNDEKKYVSSITKPECIFDDIKRAMKNELIADNYKRYVRTKECISLIKKYKDDESVVILRKQKEFPYTLKDFCYW
jgi:hypothetical protein